MRRNLTAIVLAVAALAASGCGDDDNDDGGSGGGGGEALTKAEFLEQGNKVCAEGNRELDAAFADLGPGTGPEEIEAFATETLVPNIEEQIAGLRELTPPEGDEAEVEAILAAAE